MEHIFPKRIWQKIPSIFLMHMWRNYHKQTHSLHSRTHTPEICVKKSIFFLYKFTMWSVNEFIMNINGVRFFICVYLSPLSWSGSNGSVARAYMNVWWLLSPFIIRRRRKKCDHWRFKVDRFKYICRDFHYRPHTHTNTQFSCMAPRARHNDSTPSRL